MRHLTPEKHSIHVLIILTLFAVVGPVSVDAISPSLPANGRWGAGIFMLGFSAFMLTVRLITHSFRRNNHHNRIANHISLLTDFRYLRFAVAAGAAFSGGFAFVAGGSHVFINQLGLSPGAYGAMFAIAIGSYLLSAITGTRLIKKMRRSQSSMLADSLMLMGAVTCMGSSILTTGTSVSGYLTGIIIYKMGMGFFMPLCQTRAIQHLAGNTDAASGLIFSIEILMATLISALVVLLPESGTLSLSAITLIAIAITTLCLLGVDRERDTALVGMA